MEVNNGILTRKENKDEYDKNYHKEYYLKKKASIKERVSVKVPCTVCGKMVQKQHKSKHLKTPSCRVHASYKQMLQDNN
jgi:hypothetical protein